MVLVFVSKRAEATVSALDKYSNSRLKQLATNFTAGCSYSLNTVLTLVQNPIFTPGDQGYACRFQAVSIGVRM